MASTRIATSKRFVSPFHSISEIVSWTGCTTRKVRNNNIQMPRFEGAAIGEYLKTESDGELTLPRKVACPKALGTTRDSYFRPSSFLRAITLLRPIGCLLRWQVSLFRSQHPLLSSPCPAIPFSDLPLFSLQLLSFSWLFSFHYRQTCFCRA